MITATVIAAYAWIGWFIVTGILLVLYGLTGLLGKTVFKRITRIYHLTVICYWLDRLEKEGTHCFEKAAAMSDKGE